MRAEGRVELQPCLPRVASLADIEAIERRPLADSLPADSIYGVIARSARLSGHRPAFVFLPDGDPATAPQITTYDQLHRRVTRAANLFHTMGVGPDESVAILAPNLPETQIALWGAETVAQACPINLLLEPGHVVELMAAARARVLVALGPHPDLPVWSKVEEIRARSGIAQTLVIGSSPMAAPGVQPFLPALAGQPDDRLLFDRQLDLATPAALFHTGGTTGAPKLARHRHGNQVHSAWSAALAYGLGDQDVVLNGFPLFHVAGSFCFGAAALVAGAAQLLPTATGFRNAAFMRNVWRFVEALRVSVLGAVPTVLAGLMKVPCTGADLSSVRFVQTGGSPLPEGLADAFQRQFGLPLRNLLGMTESAGMVAIEPAAAPRTPGSTGWRLPYSRVKVVPLGPEGPRLDRQCRPGETGVIVVQGPNVGPGYTDPARNAGTFTEDGWLISGDLGHLDDQQRLFVTGRAKDVIIRSAHNIDPAGIEEALTGHPAVELAAAVGQPDRYAGEVPVAFVTLKPGHRASPEDIAAFAAPAIPEPPARPKSITILDALPLTAVGKIYKPALRAMAARQAFAEALAPLALPTGGLELEGIDRRGAPAVRVTLCGPARAMTASVREALRDFAVPHEIVDG